MPRVVRTCAYLTLFALVHTSAFDPKTCGSGSLTEFKSNGMLITVDASTNTILTTQCGECPGTPTYREALDNSTARLRVMLSDISGGSDTQYTQLLVNVPFRITDTSGGDHFFYSASNMGNALCAGVTGYTPATGVGVAQIANACVVTELPTRLIRDIYGNGDAASTLGIHEWTHAYHTALPEAGDAVYEAGDPVSAALAGITAAYANFREMVFPDLDKTNHSWSELNWGNNYWYAMANEREYFAVLTEAYANAGSGNIWKWPEKRSQLLSEDPTGYAAVKAMWELPKTDVANALRGCALVSAAVVNRVTVSLLVAAIVSLVFNDSV